MVGYQALLSQVLSSYGEKFWTTLDQKSSTISSHRLTIADVGIGRQVFLGRGGYEHCIVMNASSSCRIREVC
jgi:hypothetical protein